MYTLESFSAYEATTKSRCCFARVRSEIPVRSDKSSANANTNDLIITQWSCLGTQLGNQAVGCHEPLLYRRVISKDSSKKKINTN